VCVLWVEFGCFAYLSLELSFNLVICVERFG